ncbi:hypothetical protein [Streptomyces sp. NBC_01304]|uniref:hypothetical protein n=1 Tax=Streptomyces sp. NBC_01304 TaxID=2903818 RepID=UPI002E0D5E40|nr:hypothetical protein OG430_02410 [Streptomyces sp. NBC_01304]
MNSIVTLARRLHTMARTASDAFFAASLALSPRGALWYEDDGAAAVHARCPCARVSPF